MSYEFTKVCLTKGVGRHREKLQSFEMALRSAEIANYNLVRVSSIYPPEAKLVKQSVMKECLKSGQVVFCVMSDNATDEPSRLVASSVGLAIPVDSTKHGYLCLSGDTLVEVPDRQEKIKNLVGKKNFRVYSYNVKLKKYVLALVKEVKLVEKDADVYAMNLSNGNTVVATNNHKFMMKDGSYKELKDIKPGNNLMPFYKSSDEYLNVIKNKDITKKEKNAFYNRKVMTIVPCGKQDVYCMEVEGTHNFALSAGIISSNSEFHTFGQTDDEAGQYSESLAAEMLATILDIPFDADKSWNERKGIWKLNKHIIKTKNVTQSAFGKRGLWTSVVSAAILIP